MKKNILLAIIIGLITANFFAMGKKDKETKSDIRNGQVIASTPWTAAFADIAGLDGVDSIAPANMKHPPEYEITVSDIKKVTCCKFMIYAGYERMMKTIADAAGNVALIKISTDNSVATVESQAKLIASKFHTESICEKRVASYKKTVENARGLVAERGLASKKVLVHAMQIYLAKDLGFTVTDTFGPGPLTAEQIAKAKKEGYDIIIDNIHNPVASTLAEVCPNAKIIQWRNFPEENKRGALEKVVIQNVNALFANW